MTTYYMDYENGNDTDTGASWATAWKTITTGATASRTSPGDVIRIAKSPAPVSIGNGTWTDLSKTVTLASAQTATIDLCETAWTANGSGDATVARTAVATDGKEGSYCMKITLDSSPQTSTMQAYMATTTTDFSAYQKISFWIYNSAAIVANNWTITLCAGAAGSTDVDTFAIPAIASTSRWVPLTIARNGGGNLGAAIGSIAINTGSVAPTASSYVYVDNFIACTTSGLNLQSLISKNSAQQGGSETWYGIQSINGTTVLLDNETATKANAGEGYSGTSETVTTYKRETIKTTLATSTTTQVQAIQDSGTLAGGNIEYQGGWTTTTDTPSSSDQDGETFFDGLNGLGYGIYATGRTFVTLNRVNAYRYNRGIFLTSSANNNTITSTFLGNNTEAGLYVLQVGNDTVTTIHANNNGTQGIYIDSCGAVTLNTISNANNNTSYGVYFTGSSKNAIATITKANNNGSHGVYFTGSSNNNVISNMTTQDNTTASIFLDRGRNYIETATISEATKVSGHTAFADGKVFINSIGGYSNIWCNYGNIVSQDATAGGTGKEWKMSVTNTGRASNYPMKLELAQVAVAADAQVTVTCYFKKSHATDIAASLVCPGGQIAGVAADVTATCPNDTSRNQLTVQFTPTAAGVVRLEAWAWWVANTADENVIIDDIAISQA